MSAILHRDNARHLPRSSGTGNVSIGAISIFAFVVILCMAVLAVLTVSTAHSSLVLSKRQAAATQQLYQNELAAQIFVGDIDVALSSGGGIDAVQEILPKACSHAQNITGGAVTATAQIVDDQVKAEFTTAEGRTLKVTLVILPDGTYRIDAWRMTAIVNEEEPAGTLYLGEIEDDQPAGTLYLGD